MNVGLPIYLDINAANLHHTYATYRDQPGPKEVATQRQEVTGMFRQKKATGKPDQNDHTMTHSLHTPNYCH